MKITIQKASTFTIDTGAERKRINRCFKDKPMMRKKLLKLMDLVEAGKWVEAYKELESKYWNGYDGEQECSRLEFIGLIEGEGDIDGWRSYDNLIWNMVHLSKKYSVVK